MELEAKNVKNISSLALCKEFLRQAIEQNDQLKSDYEEAIDRLKTANLIKDEQLVSTRRQKYKRCLAIAKLCRSEWAAAIFIPEKCLGDNHAKRYMRWEKRWLNIAAQFKDAK